MTTSLHFGFLLVLLPLIIQSCDGLTYNVPPVRPKCIVEDVMKGSLITGNYYITPMHRNMRLSFNITHVDFTGVASDVLHLPNSDTRSFAFIALESGYYELCFTDFPLTGSGDVPEYRRVTFNYQIKLEREDEYKSRLLDQKWEDSVMPLVQLVSDIEKEAATLIMEIKYRNGHQTAISLGVETVSSNIIFKGIVHLVLLVLVGYSYLRYIRSFLKKKKVL